MSMPSWTSPRASARTLPISRVIARARRSLCSAMSAPNGTGSRRASAPASPSSAAAPSRRPGRHRDVRGGARLEPPDDVAPVRRVDRSRTSARTPIDPLAGDEQLVGGRLGGDLGHRVAPRASGGCGWAILRARRTAVKPAAHLPHRCPTRRPLPLVMIEPATPPDAPRADVSDAIREAARRVLGRDGRDLILQPWQAACSCDRAGRQGSSRPAASWAPAGSRHAWTRRRSAMPNAIATEPPPPRHRVVGRFRRVRVRPVASRSW